jgi:hypothetical protein
MPKLDYPVIIEPLATEDGGGFVATVPDLPGCMSDGGTPEEALPQARCDRIVDRRGTRARTVGAASITEACRCRIMEEAK